MIAGNVATAEGTRFLLDRGVDGVKVGIGPGGGCTTRMTTSFGVPQGQALVDCRVLPLGKRKPHRQQVRRVDAHIETIQIEEAAHHEARAGEQHERERNLGDDEHGRPALRAHAARSGSAAFLQHFIHVGLRDVQRGSEPENDSGAEADGREEGEDRRVHPELDPERFADVLSDRIEPSGQANISSDGLASIASCRYGASAGATGITSAWPPLVVSRSYEHRTVIRPASRSTSHLRRPHSSPLRRPA